jgi:ethanolamine utilization protein EutL
MVRIHPKVLSARLIPAPHAETLGTFSKKKSEGQSFGLISSDFDHALFVALDEATKASPVQVIYAKSMYAGLSRTLDPFTGEGMGILAGGDDDIVREGLKAAVRALETISFYKTEGAGITFFPHVISSLGEYLSKEMGLSAGESAAYLIAPPVESVIALDAALKAANVRLVRHFGPPTETNRGGGLLSGELQECQAAAAAFTSSLEYFAVSPVDALDRGSFFRRPATRRE